MKSISDRANAIDKKFSELRSLVPVIFSITPVNLLSEKKKFFADPTYNPQFTYRPFKTQPSRIIFRLQKLKIPKNHIIYQLLEKKRADVLEHLRLVQARASDSFTEQSIRVYGKPDQKLISRAKLLIKKLEPEQVQVEYSLDKVMPKFRQAFIKYGIRWKIAPKSMVASAAVIPSKRTLFLRKDMRFSKKFIRQLIVHEIGTHILRVENGTLQPYRIFESGFPGYLATEEGLALYNQEINNCSNEKLMKQYAGRVLAIDYALTHSFSQTFAYLTELGFSKQDAWRLCMRVKRGLSDTAKSGAYTKDYLYLHGYYLIKEFLQSGGNISDLYYGKIGVEHVSMVKKMPGLTNPHFIPAFRYFGFFVHTIEEVLQTPFRLLNDFLLGKKR
ncbi:MAG: tyrosine/phenylalanine carboxypeptidase domain-containing protein [Candidatus Woesearchaeota archaeon]